MNQRSLSALILINFVLLAAIVAAVVAPQPAKAQFGAGSAYLMIAGEVTGRSQQAAVYIINLRTSAVIPILFNTSNNTINTYPGRIIGQDATEAIRQR